MATDPDVVALFEGANPVPEPDAIDIVVSADERLATFLHEGHSNMTLIEPTTTGTPASDRRRWLIPAAAAAVLVIVLVTGLAIFGADETVPSDSVPPTTSATTAPEESAAQPTATDLAVVDAFFTAYNAGDTDAVLAMLADGAVVTEFGPDEPYIDWDQRLAWNLAQGEVLTAPDCDTAPEQMAEGTTLFCSYETLDAVVLAVNGEPIPTSTYFTVVDGEFTVVDQRYGFRDFATLGTPFTQWMEQNHPEVTGALFHGWTSRAEAVEHGRLRAEWAQAWARSLEEPEEAIVVDGVAMAPTLPTPTSGETQQTIVGDITWTRLVGDGSTQPVRVEFVLDGDFIGTDFDDTTWRSRDGLTWTRHETPLGDLRNIVETPGETWAVRTSPGVSLPNSQNDLLRWDGTTFEPFTLPQSSAPVVDGFRRMGHRLSASRVGDRLAVVATETYDISLHHLVGGLDWQLEEVSGTTITMRSSSGRRVQLEMTGEDGAASLDLTQNGEPVGTIGPWPGVDHDELLGLLGDEQITYGELLIGSADGFDVVTAPTRLAYITDVAVLDDDLLALAREPGNNEHELWASRDGGAWERRMLPRATVGDETSWATLVGDGSDALLTVLHRDTSMPTNDLLSETWRTRDGTTWQVANGAALFDDPLRADFGWLRGHFSDFTGHIAVSPDGISWQEISVEPQTHPSADGGSIAALGDTIIISRHEGGRRELWVGKVEPG